MTSSHSELKCNLLQIFTFNSALISWVSKKQGLVTRSSMEAKLVAGFFASTEGIWLIRLAKDFRHDFMPIPFFTNNQLFILFSNNKINNNWTKHIDIHFHYTRHQVDVESIKLHCVPTLKNPTDILTKLLSPHKHAHLHDVLGVRHV